MTRPDWSEMGYVNDLTSPNAALRIANAIAAEFGGWA